LSFFLLDLESGQAFLFRRPVFFPGLGAFFFLFDMDMLLWLNVIGTRADHSIRRANRP